MLDGLSTVLEHPRAPKLVEEGILVRARDGGRVGAVRGYKHSSRASAMRWCAVLLIAGAHGFQLMPPAPAHVGRRTQTTQVAMIFDERDAISEKMRAADDALEAAMEAAVRAAEAKAAAANFSAERSSAVRKAEDFLRNARAALDAATTEKARAEAAAATAVTNAADADVAVTSAKEAATSVAAELQAWDSEHALESLGNTMVNVGADVASAAGAAAGNALLTALFGEPKAAREAREEKENEKRKVKEEEANREAEEKKTAERALAERAAAAAAKAEAAAAAAAEAEAERKVVAEAAAAAATEAEAERAAEEEAAREALDMEVRRKREAAEKALKERRARPLSEVAATSVVDAALAAAAAAGAGTNAEAWAAGRREELQNEAEVREKRSRLALFESDLQLLGLTMEGAEALDEKTLRRAFRERSRLLHPDMREQADAADLEGVPSVYELNAAFEAIKKIL